MAASVYKWLLMPVLALTLMAAKAPAPHPFHVSVVEVNHNAADKTLEVSCKVFTDDFEKVLEKVYQTKVDLGKPANKAAMDTLVKKYIFSHLAIKANGRPAALSYVGFENENEAVYVYVEVDNIPVVSKVDLTNSIMYDMFDDQIGIMHVIVGGNRKSSKVSYPEREASFIF